MAQKLFICEGEIGEDLLQRQPLAGFIADGFEVTQVNGYTTRDNRHMCVVLLAEQQNDAEPQGGNEQQGGTDPQGETTP